MKSTIKSTTKNTLSQAELDATLDNGKVAVTLLLRGKLPKGTPREVAEHVQAVLAGRVEDRGLSIDVYAGAGEDLLGDADE